ncbi:MATE family efflux transporter [Thalassobius sp. MITS945101]|uniref:MATE family efflux transporter n=1 Tax=Thalassobius sp. MITS945101 TaxID=3096994 RepID=UPI003999E1CA
MTETRANPMTSAPVNKMLFKMAAPISIGMMSTFLFQIVDTYFVGQLGALPLAALAFSASVYLIFVSAFIGLSVGASSLVAKAGGAGDRAQMARVGTLAVLLAFTLSGLLAYLAHQMIVPMFTLLGADAATLPLIHDYMATLYLGFPFLMAGIVGSGAVRASGVFIRTEVVFAIAGVINLVFDYLLIFGIGPFPEMGLAGAALATVLSFAFIFVGVLVIMAREGLLGRLPLSGLGATSRGLAQIALPTVGMQLLVPATGIFVTWLLAGFGPETVAAYGVAARIEALAMIGIFAISAAVTPFVAQNFGAAAHDRIDRAVVFAGKVNMYMGAALWIVLALSGPSLAQIFSDDPVVVRFVTLYFRIVALSYGFVGLINVTSAIFNGLQLPRQSLKISLVKALVFTVPVLLIAAPFGIVAVLVGLSFGNIAAGIYAGRVMRASERKYNRPIAEDSILGEALKDIRRLFGR